MSTRQLSFNIASRLGMTQKTVERYIRRVMNGEFKSIDLYRADSYAVALGSSGAEMWGDEWDEASPVEPYGDEDW